MINTIKMNRKIVHFKVGNGNCSVIQTEDFVMIIDLNHSEEIDSSYEMLKPFFRELDGKSYVDVLCVTHGDEDHCLDFNIFKEKIDAGDLIIGSIWHQDYDRRLNTNSKDLPKDYISLQEEIDRRKAVINPVFGDIQIPLKSMDTEEAAFKGIARPDNLFLKILSPFKDDKEDGEYSHNDLSLIFQLSLNELSILFTGDASSRYWQSKIIPDLLDQSFYEDWAKSNILVVAHHGSYDFFGEDRESVKDSDEVPDNYDALNRILPNDLIISATSKFPINGDSSGDEPPHYAAWKWYHKWFRENHDVDDEDKHPKQFKYTAEGNISIEYTNEKWSWDLNFDPNKNNRTNMLEAAAKIKQELAAGTLLIGNSLKSQQNKGFYGWND